MSPELILAISALITAILTWVSSYANSKRQIKKDEVALLREEIERLHSRIKELEQSYNKAADRNTRLLEYISRLRATLVSEGLEVAPMPSDL